MINILRGSETLQATGTPVSKQAEVHRLLGEGVSVLTRDDVGEFFSEYKLLGGNYMQQQIERKLSTPGNLIYVIKEGGKIQACAFVVNDNRGVNISQILFAPGVYIQPLFKKIHEDQLDATSKKVTIFVGDNDERLQRELSLIGYQKGNGYLRMTLDFSTQKEQFTRHHAVVPYKGQHASQVLSILKQADVLDADQDSEEAMKAKVLLDAQSILVYEEFGEVLGCIFLIDEGHIGSKWRFAVRADKRGTHIGQALQHSAFAVLQQRGLKQVDIYVNSTKLPLVSHYAKSGFSPIGEHHTYKYINNG